MSKASDTLVFNNHRHKPHILSYTPCPTNTSMAFFPHESFQGTGCLTLVIRNGCELQCYPSRRHWSWNQILWQDHTHRLGVICKWNCHQALYQLSFSQPPKESWRAKDRRNFHSFSLLSRSPYTLQKAECSFVARLAEISVNLFCLLLFTSWSIRFS
jgi:hypothetical protein